MEAVVITSNSRLDLEQLLACAPLMMSIDRLVVVDNGSTDGSPEVAVRAGATVIRREVRAGFGAAANLGIRATEGPLVALLNPDIRVRDGSALERLSGFFSDPRVAVAAPALVLPDGSIQDSARLVPTPLDLVLRRRYVRERGAIRRAGPVPWAVGACVLLRREAFESVQGFDEGYALYFEDVDLCTRLRQAGWKVLYDPSIRVLHEHRAASRLTLYGWAARTHMRSAARFYRRNPRHLFWRGRVSKH